VSIGRLAVLKKRLLSLALVVAFLALLWAPQEANAFGWRNRGAMTSGYYYPSYSSYAYPGYYSSGYYYPSYSSYPAYSYSPSYSYYPSSSYYPSYSYPSYSYPATTYSGSYYYPSYSPVQVYYSW